MFNIQQTFPNNNQKSSEINWIEQSYSEGSKITQHCRSNDLTGADKKFPVTDFSPFAKNLYPLEAETVWVEWWFEKNKRLFYGSDLIERSGSAKKKCWERFKFLSKDYFTSLFFTLLCLCLTVISIFYKTIHSIFHSNSMMMHVLNNFFVSKVLFFFLNAIIMCNHHSIKIIHYSFYVIKLILFIEFEFKSTNPSWFFRLC